MEIFGSVLILVDLIGGSFIFVLDLSVVLGCFFLLLDFLLFLLLLLLLLFKFDIDRCCFLGLFDFILGSLFFFVVIVSFIIIVIVVIFVIVVLVIKVIFC